jgi:uncharacterized protein
MAIQAEKEKLPDFLMLDNLFHVDYRYDAGPKGSSFFMEMKENKRIFANKCPQCGRMCIPPRPFCGLCNGVEMTEWVEQGDTGTVEIFSIQYYKFDHPHTGEALDVPYASGQIRLDGGALMQHYFYPPDPKAMKQGDRVKAVWRENRRGHFTDILYFVKSEEAEKKFVPTGAKPMDVAPHSTPSMLKIKYRKTAGSICSHFLMELRDKAIISGTKCDSCGKVYAPAMETCDQCYRPISEFVPLSGKGVVTAFTIVREAERQHPISVPFAIAIIKMDGADTGMTHILGEMDDLSRIAIGMEVVPVFKNERSGSILDIKYFKPASKAVAVEAWTFTD